MTHRAEPGPSRTDRESRALRLGFALRALAADLVDERRTVAELRRSVAELRSRLEAVQATQARDQAEAGALLEACPPWARWNGERERRYTLGVEEELMLLEPGSCSLAQSSDHVLARLSDELSLHASPETHAAVIELRTGVHTNVDGVVGELADLRGRLARELGALGFSAAAAGTYPLRSREETMVSGAAATACSATRCARSHIESRRWRCTFT